MRLNQIARKLNVSIVSIVDYLQTKGVHIEALPNVKLSADQVAILNEAFAASAAQKAEAAKITIAIQPPTTPSPPQEKHLPTENTKPLADLSSSPPKLAISKPTFKGIGELDLHPKEASPSSQRNAVDPSLPSPDQGVTLKGFTVLGNVKVPLRVPRKQFFQVASSDQTSGSRPRKRISIRKPLSKAPLSDKEMQEKVSVMIDKLQQSQGTEGFRAKHRKKKREKISRVRTEQHLEAQDAAQIIHVTEHVTAHDFAKLMDVPINSLLTACMDLDVIVSINQRLDEEIITLIAEEFGKKVSITHFAPVPTADTADNERTLEPRAPIVTIMGHVDHGKTSLLDHIRKSSLTKEEIGGITQRLAAYDVTTSSHQRIVFLDTPGHKLFTAMRARSGQITDIVVLLVAADDGVMPQTKEAVTHAQTAGVPIIIAINKVDKPNTNPDKVREGLAQINIMVEEWGGHYLCQEISAKTGKGIPELLEKIAQTAVKLQLKANSTGAASGTVLEASLDPGRGYLTTIIVNRGTLNVGDTLIVGPYFGKVKVMIDSQGNRITQAPPSTPVQVLGLNGTPQAGEQAKVMASEREARILANKRQHLLRDQMLRTKHISSFQAFQDRLAKEHTELLNILIKGDSDGSIGALADALPNLANDEIHLNIIHKAVGAISESDVLLAATTKATILGFHTKPTARARALARQENVTITLYHLIYDAIDHVKKMIDSRKQPVITYTTTGHAKVLKTFNITRVGRIAGCQVTEGTIRANGHVRFLRDGNPIFTGPIKQLKREKEHIKEAKVRTECGINVTGFQDVAIGDIVEALQQNSMPSY